MSDEILSRSAFSKEWDAIEATGWSWALTRGPVMRAHDEALRADRDRLAARLAEVRRERDDLEASMAVVAAGFEHARARVATLEAALRDAEEVLAQTFKVLLTVKGRLDHPYPDAPTLTPWTRWCEPLARRAYDTRRLVRAALAPDSDQPPVPEQTTGAPGGES